METSTKDYYASFGMSSYDFNSMIRARFLDDLIQRLIEENLVGYRGLGDGLANVEEEQAEPARAPTTTTTVNLGAVAATPVTAVATHDKTPRPASSVYSRDIDGNSYRSASTVQDFSSRSASFGSLLPPLMNLENSCKSNSVLFPRSAESDNRLTGLVGRNNNIENKSLSCPSWASSNSLLPAPLNWRKAGGETVTYIQNRAATEDCSPIAVEIRAPDYESNSPSTTSSTSKKICPSALVSQVTSTGSSSSSSSSSRTLFSSPAKSISSSATSASNIGTPPDSISNEEPAWPRRWLSSVKETFRTTSTKVISMASSSMPQDQAEKTYGNDGQQADDEFHAALLVLQQQFKHHQQRMRQDLHPEFDHVVELGRLRRKVASLDFDSEEMIVVASDMTTCMQMPRVPGQGGMAHVDVDLFELAYQEHCRKYSRERLSRRVQRRMAWLKAEAKGGSVRKIEDWYRDVVGIVGWCDEEEAQLPWGWREKDGFF